MRLIGFATSNSFKNRDGIDGFSLIYSTDVDPTLYSQAFEAVAYKHDATGEIIISYRGTDEYDTTAPNNDVVEGWLQGGGAQWLL